MTAPNATLRAIRMGMLLSQDEFAAAIRAAGDQTGQPNDASKRLVQRWESGQITSPRPVYARALEAVTGLPIASLGFSAISVPGEDVEPGDGAQHIPQAAPAAVGSYSGIWLSRYEYPSSTKGTGTYVGMHYVVVLQHGDRLTVRSLPGSSDSPLTMDLTVDGTVVTGTWVEQTAADGHYRGARYHGALQMLVEPTGRRMAGRWVGFGRQLEINTGPWELVLQDASTGRAALDRHNHPPPEA